jgi:D-alanyl-D-alanine carboxypeptidase
MARLFGLVIVIGVVLLAGFAFWRSTHSTRPPHQEDASRVVVDVPPPSGAAGEKVVLAVNDGPDCRGSVAFDEAARRNAQSASTLSWAPFGRTEVGWMTYGPLIAHEIGAGCSPASPVFAEALAGWERAHGFPPDGVLTAEQFEAMKTGWHRRRPFVAARTDGACPDPPPEAQLAVVDPAVSYGGKHMLLRPGALAAYHRLLDAARREVPGLKDNPQMLQIFSAYRSPTSDAARCAAEQNCNGIVRASCSPHRTGLAVDVVMGNAPGYPVDSSADPNRLYMAQTPAYRWMVANADRFGFVNYPFEPWHWEWTGEGVSKGNGPALALLNLR